jgi:spermidine synthase
VETLTKREKREPAVLLVSVFIVAACALTYELLIGTVSSYYLGSSVLHFSLTIGLFMFFLGVGAFLSKFISNLELEAFINFESMLGVCGGLSVALLQASFCYTEHYYLVALMLTGAIGVLCGFEIPLLTRLLYRYQGLKSTIAHALSFDYVGGLAASIVFPLVLLPNFGTLKTACLVGLVNLCVASLIIWEFRAVLRRPRRMAMLPLLGAAVTALIFMRAEALMSVFEQALYDDEVVFASQSPYQRIVLTQFRDDIRLYLNGDLQFSSQDEHRYHEPLVHYAMQLAHKPRRVLVLGGGDGLAAREVLHYPGLEQITRLNARDQRRRPLRYPRHAAARRRMEIRSRRFRRL